MLTATFSAREASFSPEIQILTQILNFLFSFHNLSYTVNDLCVAQQLLLSIFPLHLFILPLISSSYRRSLSQLTVCYQALFHSISTLL